MGMLKSGVIVLLFVCILPLTLIGVVHAQNVIVVTTNKTTYNLGDTVIVMVTATTGGSPLYVAIGVVGTTSPKWQLGSVYPRATKSEHGQLAWFIPTSMTPGSYAVYAAVGGPSGWESYAGFTVTS